MALMLAALTTFALAQASESIPDFQAAPAPLVQTQPTFDPSRYVPVVTSLVVPGSGQMLQGAWLKGLAHLGFCAACLAATQLGASQPDGTLRLAGSVGLVGVGLWSPWDAFARAHRPQEEPTP